MDVIKLLLIGATLGVICGLFRLPCPAPQVWQGVIGIAAITIAYQITIYLLNK